MILSLLKYCKGYLHVRLTGFAPERFINLCSNHNILIWDLQYREGAYEFYITVGGYRQIRPFVKKSKTRLRIIEKFGLPFFLYKNRKRKVFFFGFLCFWMLIFSMSLFIWDIEIEGNYTYTEDVLLAYLKEQNISHGMMRGRVDVEEIKSMLRNEYMEITWVSAQVSGTRLLIQVKENYGLLDIPIKDTRPCDLVAAKDGIITEIVTRSGIPQVKPGDVVTKGQVLVSGTIPITNDAEEVVSTNYVHSDATIKASTVYDYTDSFSLLHTEKSYSGNVKNGGFIRIFNSTLQIHPFWRSFETYDTIREENQLKLFSNFYLPVYTGRIRLEEYIEYDSKYSAKTAFRLAAENLQLFCTRLEDNDVVIAEKQVNAVIENDVCTSSGKIKVFEEIGEPAYLEVPEEVPQELPDI